MDTSKSEFYHFGILPSVCIHSPHEDQYSKMFIPREKCDCGHDKWMEEGSTMILGHYPDGTPIYKDVHRCEKCNQVRMSDHIGNLGKNE